MLRTQIYLPKALYQRVQLIARKENLPTAEIIRELLADSLTRKSTSVGKALLELAKIGGKGPADLSSSIDKYLYET